MLACSGTASKILPTDSIAGWSQAQLAAHDWNLPQMKLWEGPKLVQTLGSIGPEEYNKAQARVRGLVS